VRCCRYCLTPAAYGGDDRIEELEAALTRIIEWADAYPFAVFPEVDEDYAKRAHTALTEHGMTLDRLSADVMRHVLTGVRRIASGALHTQGDAAAPSGDAPAPRRMP